MSKSVLSALAASSGNVAEHLLILSSATSTPDLEDVESHVRLVEDLSRVHRRSIRHGVLPLVYRSLRNVAAAVSGDGLRQFQRSFHVLGLSSNFGAAILAKLSGSLAERSIPHLTFKGPVFAIQAYGDVALRQPGDLDLLVRRPDFMRTSRLLIDFGYEPFADSQSEDPLADGLIEKHIGRHKGLLLKNRAVSVDLHWTLDDYPFNAGIPVDGLFERTVQVEINGCPVPTPSLEDTFVFLCVHGTKHNWIRLGWIVDIAELMRPERSVNWAEVMGTARASRSEHLVHLAFLLAEGLLGARIPPPLAENCRRDDLATDLAHQVAGWIFRPPTVAAINRFRLRMFRGVEWKARYLFHRLRGRFARSATVDA